MAERGKGFPRINLSSAVQIMDAASKFGKSWKKEQFAGFGAKSGAGSAKSGAFAARVSALKDYGLVVGDKESIASTELAQRLTKPINADEREQAVKKAFLSVATFNDLYMSFDANEALPRDKVAEHAVFQLGISRDSKDKFVNVFIDSGEYAGLVKYDKESQSVILLPSDDSDASPGEYDRGDAKADTPNDNNPADIISGFTPKAVAVAKQGDSTDSSAMNEQGVNHSGDGWGLTVLVKSSHRLPADLRKAIRDLLETADEVADKFYDLEKRGNGHESE